MSESSYVTDAGYRDFPSVSELCSNKPKTDDDDVDE